MTEAEEQQLRELGNELAGAMQSDWQPACIARAWALPAAGTLALTMQGWIDLEAAHSPLLGGQLPVSDAELEAAFAAFGLGTDELTGHELVTVVQAMQRAVGDAFAAALRMAPPEQGAAGSEQGDDGFGDWLPMLAFLIVQAGLSRGEALALRVDQAFMLMAACKRNERWTVAGTAYALRDVAQPEGVTRG